jgi:hypothetical protein
MAEQLDKAIDSDMFSDGQAKVFDTASAIEVDRVTHSALLHTVAVYARILEDIANAPIRRTANEIAFCGIRLAPSAAETVSAKILVAADELKQRQRDASISKAIKPIFEAAHDPH